MGFSQRISEAEQLREEGHLHSAIVFLREIIREAKEQHDPRSQASALGHLIVCYKHIYENQNLDLYLEEIEILIQSGLDLNIPEQEKAVFHLRRGDISLSRRDFDLAEFEYETAARLKKGTLEYPEYLGHLAEAKRLNGSPSQALVLLKDALQRVVDQHQYRTWHHMIIVSGLLAKLGLAARDTRRFVMMGQAWFKGYILALWLSIYYRMPKRLEQYHKMLF